MPSTLNYNTMKGTLLLLSILCLALHVRGQDAEAGHGSPAPRNALYVSLGGAGIYYSIVYERQVIRKNDYQVGIKGGVGTSFSSALFPTEFNFPVGAFFLYGKRHSHLDVSINFTNYILDQYDYVQDRHSTELRVLYVPSVSYRYQKRDGGFVARAGFSTIIHFNPVTNTVAPWLDLSVGWAF